MADSVDQRHKDSVADSGTEHREHKQLWNGEHGSHDESPTRAPSRGQKMLLHLKRYRNWYIALFCAVIFLVIFLPIFFLVIIPALVRAAVSDLPVRGGLLEPVSPSLVRMSLTTELTTPAGLAADLDAFRLDLYTPHDKDDDAAAAAADGQTQPPAFATLDVPARHLRGRTAVEIPEQVVRVLDAPALQRFLARAFDAERAVVGVRGSSVVRLGAGLAYATHIDQPVAFEGLRRLAGLRVEALEPVVPAEADGTSLRGSLWVSNHSPLTVGMGNVTYDVLAGGVRVGETTVENLRMVPGNQTIEYKGKLDSDVLIANIRDVLGSLNEEGDLEFVVTGNQSMVNNERIGYLDEVLSKINVKASFTLCQAMKSLPQGAMMKMPLDVMMLLPFDKIVNCSKQ